MSRRPPPRSILITGASSGLGAALARSYAAPGLSLGLIGRDRARLQAVAEACAAAGAAVAHEAIDVRDGAALAAWIGDFDARFPVDAVIAAAGVSASVAPDGPLLEEAALTTRQIETNLLGVVNTLSPLLPALTGRRRGAVALVSSVAGLRGLPYSPGYSASKAGVRAYGEALRPLLGPLGVSVTVVTPGFFDTPMTDRWQGDTPMLWSLDRTARAVRRAIDRGAARLTFPWPLAAALRLADLAPPWIVDPILRRFHFHILPPR